MKAFASVKSRILLGAVALSVIASASVLSACGKTRSTTTFVAVYPYDEGVLNYNPLSASRNDQSKLQLLMNEMLFYTNEFYVLRGGLAKNPTNDANSGLFASTDPYSATNPTWVPYKENDVLTYQSYKVVLKDEASFVDYSGKFKEKVTAQSFINAITYYLWSETSAFNKLFGNEADDGGAFVFDAFWDWSTLVAAGDVDELGNDGNPTGDHYYYSTIDLAKNAATDNIVKQGASDKELILNTNGNVRFIDHLQSTNFMPLPNVALDNSNANMYGVKYGIGTEDIENEKAYKNAYKYAYYTGHYLPTSNAASSGERIKFKARSKSDKYLATERYNSINNYEYIVVDSSKRNPASSRKDYESVLTSSFSVNLKDSAGFEKYVGKLNNKGNYEGNRYLPKSTNTHYVSVDTETESSNWVLVSTSGRTETEMNTNLGGTYAPAQLDNNGAPLPGEQPSIFIDSWYSPNGSKIWDSSQNKFINATQAQLFDDAGPAYRNPLFLRTEAGAAYFAFFFNKSIVAHYYGGGNDEKADYQDEDKQNVEQIPSAAVYNKWVPSGLSTYNNGTQRGDYTDLIGEKLSQLYNDPSYSVESGIDSSYHNYYVGKRIVQTDPTALTQYEEGFDPSTHKITDYDKVFNAINSVIPGIISSATGSSDDITLYLPVNFAEEVLSSEFKTAYEKTVANFNNVPNAKVHMVLQYCDLNPTTGSSRSNYSSFQPYTFGNSLHGHKWGKYVDFVQIGWGKDYGDPINFYNDALDYYNHNGFFDADDSNPIINDRNTANLTQTYPTSYDRYVALANFEAQAIYNFRFFPWYGTELTGTYGVSHSKPRQYPITTNGSNDRLATAGDLSKNPISQENYYRTKYIYNELNGFSNEWWDELNGKFNKPVDSDKDYKEIIAKKNTH